MMSPELHLTSPCPSSWPPAWRRPSLPQPAIPAPPLPPRRPLQRGAIRHGPVVFSASPCCPPLLADGNSRQAQADHCIRSHLRILKDAARGLASRGVVVPASAPAGSLRGATGGDG